MTTPNNSSTGGYLLPAVPAPPLPGSLTLDQFLQTVFVGVSGIVDPTLVRPRWQIDPPKSPDITTDWIAFGVTEDNAIGTAYNSLDSNNNNVVQRMEDLVVQVSFYGPDALTFAQVVRDGLQIGQNREALQSAKMDFVDCGRITRAPDIVNERWRNRYEMTVNFRREILRVYPILTFVSFTGTLYTLGSHLKTIALNAE